MVSIADFRGSRFPATVALSGPAVLPTVLGGPDQGVLRRFARQDEIFCEGEPCDFFYKVVSGTVRTGKLLSDGRRQIDGFHVAGDIFGLESGDEHRFTAEAVDDVELVAWRRSSLGRLVASDPRFGERILSSTLTSLDRAHDHMVLLGRKTAMEKVASFLTDLARRTSCGDRVRLPMQRADIADYLGLTIETVSRTLTQMVRAGLIRICEAGRTVILTNRTNLDLLRA